MKALSLIVILLAAIGGEPVVALAQGPVKKGYPASTLVESPHLALPEVLIEITAIAVVP